MGLFSFLGSAYWEKVEDNTWLKAYPNHPYKIDPERFPVCSGNCLKRLAKPGRHVWIYNEYPHVNNYPTVRGCRYCKCVENNISGNTWYMMVPPIK